MKAKEKAIVFIDGSNFYHSMQKIGLSSGIGLDYEKFALKLVGDRSLMEIRYYVGQVKQDGYLDLYTSQRKFFEFLGKSEKVNVRKGRIESQPNTAGQRLSNWIKYARERTDIAIPESVFDELEKIAARKRVIYYEKAVDVMIAVDMVSMAHSGDYDVAYLISADGDFTPAVGKAREMGRKIFVASPGKGHRLAQVANSFIPLSKEFFDGCWC